MSDTEFDVVIAVYLIPDPARKDFDALAKLIEEKQLEVEGSALLAREDGHCERNTRERGHEVGRGDRWRRRQTTEDRARRGTSRYGRRRVNDPVQRVARVRAQVIGSSR
jgi:hypothetical protein